MCLKQCGQSLFCCDAVCSQAELLAAEPNAETREEESSRVPGAICRALVRVQPLQSRFAG